MRFLGYILLVFATFAISGCKERQCSSCVDGELGLHETYMRSIVIAVGLSFMCEDKNNAYTNIDEVVHNLDAKQPLIDYISAMRTKQGLIFNPDINKWRSSAFQSSANEAEGEIAIIFTNRYLGAAKGNGLYLGMTYGLNMVTTNTLPPWVKRTD